MFVFVIWFVGCSLGVLFSLLLLWWLVVWYLFCSVCLRLFYVVGWLCELVWFAFALRWYLGVWVWLVFVFGCCGWMLLSLFVWFS